MSSEKWPWEVYSEETQDYNKYPKEYKDAVWWLNSKPIKDEPQYSVFMDKYPAVEGHRLYIPKTNDAPGMIGLCFQEAYRDGMEMIKEGKIEGFNMGMNINEVAGQSIFWPHVHFLPRHKNDIKGRNAGMRMAVYTIDPYNPDNQIDKKSK